MIGPKRVLTTGPRSLEIIPCPTKFPPIDLIRLEVLSVIPAEAGIQSNSAAPSSEGRHPGGEGGEFMVMPSGMTTRPNGQAWIACPVLPAEQESGAGELAVSANQRFYLKSSGIQL